MGEEELNKIKVEAIAGGKYRGQVDRFIEQTPGQLRKSIDSFEQQINRHQEWLNNPTSKIEDWYQRSNEFRDNNLNHWQNDIQRAQIYRELAKTILELKNTPTNTPPKLP